MAYHLCFFCVINWYYHYCYYSSSFSVSIISIILIVVIVFITFTPPWVMGLLDFKVSYYSRPLLVRSSPAETTSRDCLECPPPETAVRLPGVPNPTDYRETPQTTRETLWSAQPGDPRP